MKIIFEWLRFLSWLIGLPVIGWWLAGQLVDNPPIVAPFLVTSPLYAIAISIGVFGYRHAKDAVSNKQPLSKNVSEHFAAKHDAQLGRYAEKMALVADAHMIGHLRIWQNWLLINEQTWNSLTNAGREFLLVRSTLRTPRKMSGQLLSAVCFVLAYTLASLNLWLIIPIHICTAVTLVMVGNRFPSESETRLDKAAMAITGDYKGALEYIRRTKKENDKVHGRIQALRNSAFDLGLLAGR